MGVPRLKGDCGHCGPKLVAFIGELRFREGGWGACQRRDPVGEAAKRILKAC
jgi:hypothetical protein